LNDEQGNISFARPFNFKDLKLRKKL